MLGFRKLKQVAEHEADGEIERIYYEIMQTLRVSGINLNFRIWARYDKFFAAMWRAVRPNAETRAFEDAADHLRTEALHWAERVGKMGAASRVTLGDSQRYHLQAALDLYHYINPKLLVLTAAVQLAVQGERLGRDASPGMIELIERGVPARMAPMEMVAEDPGDQRLEALFEDIKKTFGSDAVHSDYRTLALWPDYFAAAWALLKPKVQHPDYREACNRLRDQGVSLARALPYPVPLSPELIRELGEDLYEIKKITAAFVRLLPPLILNIALLQLDWRPPEVLMSSPFPARLRSLAGAVATTSAALEGEGGGEGRVIR